MSPLKYLLLNQLVMKICLYVCRDGNFFILIDEVKRGHSILSDCIAHGPYWSKFSCSLSMFRTWLEPEEFVNTITQKWFHFTNFQIPITWHYNSIQLNSFICHTNTSIHQHINAFTVKWSGVFRKLKSLYVPIQIQLFYRNTTQVITAAIKWENC